MVNTWLAVFVNFLQAWPTPDSDHRVKEERGAIVSCSGECHMGVGAMEAHHKEFHKMMANYDEDDGLMGMIETITTQMAATDKKLKELEADDE